MLDLNQVKHFFFENNQEISCGNGNFAIPLHSLSGKRRGHTRKSSLRNLHKQRSSTRSRSLGRGTDDEVTPYYIYHGKSDLGNKNFPFNFRTEFIFQKLQ